MHKYTICKILTVTAKDLYLQLLAKSIFAEQEQQDNLILIYSETAVRNHPNKAFYFFYRARFSKFILCVSVGVFETASLSLYIL